MKKTLSESKAAPWIMLITGLAAYAFSNGRWNIPVCRTVPGNELRLTARELPYRHRKQLKSHSEAQIISVSITPV
jgi:hypothetical protein